MTFRIPTNNTPNIRETVNGNPLNIIDDHETNNLWSIIYTDIVNIYGDEISYIVVTNDNLIDFFGEYKSQILQSAYPMRIINNTLFDTNSDTKTTQFMTDLGLVANQDQVIHVPKKTFDSLGFVPRIGDCVYVNRTNNLYRIQFVDYKPFDKFQGQDLAYELKMTLFTINSNTTVDQSVKDSIYNIDFIETINDEIKALNNDKVSSNVLADDIVDNSESNGRL